MIPGIVFAKTNDEIFITNLEYLIKLDFMNYFTNLHNGLFRIKILRVDNDTRGEVKINNIVLRDYIIKFHVDFTEDIITIIEIVKI